jgi:integrase
MRQNFNDNNDTGYTGYSDLLVFFKRKCRECPKGVTLRLNQRKYIQLQFIDPATDKRTAKPCNVKFTEEGIILAVGKAHKVAIALNTCENSNDFWSWYDRVILEINQIENNLKTYGEIFAQIETEFFNGRNKNTKRKRSKKVPNDLNTFERQYGIVFNRFTNLESYPTWEVINSVLFSWEQGSKSFKDVYTVIKKICELSANSKELLPKLEQIDNKQYDFKDKQSISLEQYLNWYKDCYSQIEQIKHPDHRRARKQWLWVTAILVVYGLRPSEVAAIQNLTNPVTIDNITFKSLDDPDNQDLLLVLGDTTYFGTTIKTGKRICAPMTNDRELIELLQIQTPDLPIVHFKENATSKFKVNCFSGDLRKRLISYKCPITQPYALRHLANQLGELHGIPQEIRARSLGHSVAINDSVYKARNNTETTVSLLTNHSKLPIAYNLAQQKLQDHGFNLDDPQVINILKIIYQL